MTDTAADRARLAGIPEWWADDAPACDCIRCTDIRWLVEKVQDGIAAREALARVETLCDEWEAGPWSWFRDAAKRVRRAITGEAT